MPAPYRQISRFASCLLLVPCSDNPSPPCPSSFSGPFRQSSIAYRSVICLRPTVELSLLSMSSSHLTFLGTRSIALCREVRIRYFNKGETAPTVPGCMRALLSSGHQPQTLNQPFTSTPGTSSPAWRLSKALVIHQYRLSAGWQS